MGEEDTSTFLIAPRNRFWNVALAVRSRMLIPAVKGLSRTKDVSAMPVCTISVGNTNEALVIRFWCRAGIVVER